MAIQVNSELEALIQADIEQGGYESADDFVECAVQMLHHQELWLRENREVIAAKVEQGYASAEHGELADISAVRARMDERKQAWLTPRS